MQKEKVRVYALARELDMESKDLLDMCRQAGYDVKTCRVIGIGRVPRPEAHGSLSQNGGGGAAPIGTRAALADDRATELTDVPVFRAIDLRPGPSLSGPALIEYPDSTILVPSRAAATIDTARNLTIEVYS